MLHPARLRRGRFHPHRRSIPRHQVPVPSRRSLLSCHRAESLHRLEPPVHRLACRHFSLTRFHRSPTRPTRPPRCNQLQVRFPRAARPFIRPRQHKPQSRPAIPGIPLNRLINIRVADCLAAAGLAKAADCSAVCSAEARTLARRWKVPTRNCSTICVYDTRGLQAAVPVKSKSATSMLP